MEQIDITPIIEAIFGLAAVVLCVVFVPILKNQLGADKFARFKELVAIAVSAAEQIFPGKGLGIDKKNYVLEFLNSKGYTYDEATVEVLIESNVQKLKSSTKD